ncbi:MAG: hypothetical protein Q9160_000869 [Pyrenula sp. 1 TL-2023]
MEAYSEDFVAHNFPLVVLSGLGDDPAAPSEQRDQPRTLLHEGGFRVTSDLPLLKGRLAAQLLEVFQAADSTTAPWLGRPLRGSNAGPRYRIKRTGRTYALPPRKAPPPPHSPRLGPSHNGDNAPPPIVLHSTLSPLTPSSPLFPDGIITPLWITKHQNRLPAVFIFFLPFTSDPNTSSLLDNRLKIEINTVKSVFTSTNYKTKLIAVLLCEEGDDSPLDVDDRLPSIRRATGLDTKSLLFLSPESSKDEVRDFTNNLLSNLQSNCLEYYRDLSKHARRKRNRGNAPPPTGPPVSGTSQVLPAQGWNVRYEFKMGIFAEFRQEMDAAGRNFDNAYEILVNSELLESFSHWSPRFNEARMLADVIAIRTIRCLLWNGSPSAAVKSWLNHRERIRDFINRRGKGTRSYGWEAWEALWTKTMAQLIERADLTAFKLTDGLDSQLRKASSIFIYSDNTKASTLAERMHPWELLHHQGYWLRMSAKHQAQRRLFAKQLPEEDRIAPGQSPASRISNRSDLYDTYLTTEPHDELPLDDHSGFDHSAEIVTCLQSSVSHFASRQQIRSVEAVGLQMASEYIGNRSWTEAMCILRPMWSSLSWRQAGWWGLVEEIAWPLRDCAVHVRDAETVLRLDWELQNKAIPRRNGWKYDLHGALNDFDAVNPKPAVVLKSDDVLACIEPSFVFQAIEGNVGEPLKAQLSLFSHTHEGSKPIRLSEVKVVFEGSLRSIRLQSDENESSANPGSDVQIFNLNLRDSSVAANTTNLPSPLPSPNTGVPSLIGISNLTVHPGQIKIWNLTCIPREAGDVRAVSITLLVDDDQFSLAYVLTPSLESFADTWWEYKNGKPTSRCLGRGQDLNVAKILPKPPKVRIDIPGLRKVYYTGETLSLPIKVLNDEETACTISLAVHLVSSASSLARIRWEDESSETDSQESLASHVPSRSIGELARSESKTFPICVEGVAAAVDYDLEVSATYYLITDMDTPIHKSLIVKIPFIRPFEANSDLHPRLDPTPWPDFFQLPQINSSESRISAPSGLQQTFALTTKLASFAAEPLVLESIRIVESHVTGDAVWSVGSSRLLSPGSSDPSANLTPHTVQPKTLVEFSHDLLIRKLTIGDLNPVILDLSLQLTWRRESEAEPPTTITTTTTTLLPFRSYQLPFGEPRVLLTSTSSSRPAPLQSPATTAPPTTTHLTYTLENPSLHYLTFSLTMDSSEHFAFSGPKHLALSLTPLSRASVDYKVLVFNDQQQRQKKPGGEGGMEIRPNLVVLDTHFRKVLRVLGAGENVRTVGAAGGGAGKGGATAAAASGGATGGPTGGGVVVRL